MRQQQSISRTQIIIEQIALLFTSFVWTSVILSILVLVWVIQDIESNWDVIVGMAPTPTPPAELAIFIEPTATPWQPTATPTPTEMGPPTETATLVMPPPSILPDTPNLSDPLPVVVHTEEEIPELTTIITATVPVETLAAVATATPMPTDTPVSTPIDDEINNPPPAPTATTPPTATPLPAAPAPSPETVEISPSRVVIPAVSIDSEVIPVGWSLVEQGGQQFTIWQVADYAIGWHKSSALPGQVGNTVMAGHHNINGEVFRELVNVEVGDEVTIYVGDTPYNYKVELKTIVKEKGESLEVRQRNAEWIAPTTDERITMVTCWPYTNNTHRVIVVAKPI